MQVYDNIIIYLFQLAIIFGLPFGIIWGLFFIWHIVGEAWHSFKYPKPTFLLEHPAVEKCLAGPADAPIDKGYTVSYWVTLRTGYAFTYGKTNMESWDKSATCHNEAEFRSMNPTRLREDQWQKWLYYYPWRCLE